MGNGQSKENESKSPAAPNSLLADGSWRKSGGSGAGSGGSAGIGRQRSPQHTRSSHQHARSGSAGLSLLSSTTPTTSTTEVSNIHATNVSSSPSRSRPRSVTSAGTTATHPPHLQPLLEALPIAYSHRSDSGAMGNSDSKAVRPPSRANTVHVQTPSPSHNHRQTPEQPAQQPLTPPPARPQDVPPPSTADVLDQDSHTLVGYSESPYNLPPANYSRPPRLPLPIEEEVHTPGSPIITPQDIQESATLLEQTEFDVGPLPRKSSVLSSTTVDDDDVGDNEAFAPDTTQWGETRVPTRLEWNGAGDKIFVTGTFCNWEKKVKLHDNKDKPGFSATVNLRPGTHHVKFLVDGEMVTSNDLPTTVDWTNILVNYIEIVAPMPSTATEAQPPAPATPMPIPGAALTAGQTTGTDGATARPLTDGADVLAPQTEGVARLTLDEAGRTVDQTGLASHAPADEATTKAVPAHQTTTTQPHAKAEPTSKHVPSKQKVPRPKYTSQIPDFLIDLDNYNHPEDERFQRAQRVASILPAPPSLPMFLSKSILNGTTPHKDDASVLIMPNHTVLNHLATSSIKSGVLATSGTTRYKRKFLTSIMYKPTSDDG